MFRFASLPRSRGTGSAALTAVAAALLLAVAPASTPFGASALEAQFGIGLRAGSVGIGVDVGVALGERISLRAGGGALPFSTEQTLGDQDYTIEPPPALGVVGLDVQVAGPLRLTGGLMWRSDDITFETDVSGSTDIGGTTYTASGNLSGALEGGSVAPYVGIGLGRIVGSGFGVYADLGVGIFGDPTLALEASGPITDLPDFSASLEQERQDAEDDIPGAARLWAALSVGVRFGVGQ
ncbi:MAG: hypothetical protein WEA09_09435 [Gemmatimonadota bacterium]